MNSGNTYVTSPSKPQLGTTPEKHIDDIYRELVKRDEETAGYFLSLLPQ